MPQSSSVRVLILILLIATFLAPRTRGETTVHDYRTWGAVADTLRGVQMGRRTALANAFVQVGSDSVYVNQTRLSRDQYRINYHMGTIRIDAPMPPQAIVIVYYQRQPVLLNPVYSLRPIEVSDPEAALQVPPQRVQSPEREIEETPRNLVFGGSKSVSFSVGSNRGSSLDQDLQATIEGQITPTIRVRALLSDNNLPIQPQGNTEELQYFDQVFVEIEGTQARATMGDFAFANNISTYSPITRQLRGASVSAWKGGTGRLSASGATSKGIFRSVQFRGVTGLQGPYELLSAARINQEVIIAGTEVVYADGVEMRRGQNQDYVIDYDRGTVTFSPRRLITRDTEIAVDFEVTQESYIRTALFATGEEVRITAGAHLDLLFAQESDDKDDPTNTSFSVEDIEALANAGDNSDAAITGGVTQVPPGEGQYVLVPPDTVVGTQEFFVFNDSIGDYNVQFVEVEPRTGDYVLGGISRTGQRYFEFVSDGSGTYTVGRQLPLPERKQLLTARFRRTDMRHLTFDFEWNVSNYDRNLFSTIDDDDNVGQAGRAKIGIGNIPLGRGVLALTGRVSSLEEEFSSFDRARPQYFYRDWNLENVVLRGRELIADGEVGFSTSGSGTIRYNLGALRRDDFDGVKHEGNLSLGSVAERGVTARAFDSETSSVDERRTRRHLTAEASYAFWRIVPTLTYGTERYRQYVDAAADTGQAYELVRIRLARRNPQGLSLHIDAEERVTDEVDPNTDEWRESRTDQTLSAAMSVRRYRSVQGEMQYTHRIEDDATLGRTTTDLGRLKSTIRSESTGIRSDIDYEISQEAGRTLERSVIFVGEGNGDFNAQGELVGKDKGAFTIVFSPTENIVPTIGVAVNLRFAWKPAEGGRGIGAAGLWGWIRKNVSLDWTFGVREQTTYDPAWKVFLLVPSALQRDGATLFGTSTIRQDWSLLEGVKNMALTLRYQRQDTEDNRFEGIRENRVFEELQLRLSRSLSEKYTATAELGRSVNRRDGSGIPAATGSSYDIVGGWVLGGLGVRFSPGSTVDIDVKAESQEDHESSAQQIVLSVTPRLVWRVSGKVNVFGSYEYNQTLDRGDASIKPIPFLQAGDSHRWSVAPNIRLARVISIVATYQGRSETIFNGSRITEHELRLETRALF